MPWSPIAVRAETLLRRSPVTSTSSLPLSGSRMSNDRTDLSGRCGTCARFVRVIESIDQNGEVRRSGECLLGVWPAPLYETNTCSQYVQRGTFTAKPSPRPRAAPAARSRTTFAGVVQPRERSFQLPEEL